MSKYRVSNNTRQDGVIKVHGDWIVVHPGDTKILDSYPMSYTHGLTIIKVLSESEVHYIKQPKVPSSKPIVTVDKTNKKEDK